jgi:TrmH family RNA methyltransferase
MEVISKAKIKWVRSLQQKKHRELESVFVVEGEKMVQEGLSQPGAEVLLAVVHKDAQQLVPSPADFPVFMAGNAEMEQLSALKTPNKLLAVFKRPADRPISGGFQLVLDGVQDPGNMGTILRLADWFGIRSIICSETTVDCYNPKVIQASMGAIFRIQVHYRPLLPYLKQSGLPVYGALLNGENYTKVSYPDEGILLMGNEGSGISSELLSVITHPVTIPRLGEAESLNVATATAILLAECKRTAFT